LAVFFLQHAVGFSIAYATGAKVHSVDVTAKVSTCFVRGLHKLLHNRSITGHLT